MEETKCYFLTVEVNSEFDKLFQEWLENLHFSNFDGKKIIEGFVSCDFSDDYDEEDFWYNKIKY
ncbi:MAG: hypothetical protein GPJ00_08725 [Microcystis aeruginosa W13-18]|jgi:hypothetical protein|nr:hypothetical protein [Microcystis aeruginosa W13-18]NCR37808.1 hypothetical protein [Microcystis aeruginosa S11-05]NCR51309.1 hypothetical protein [Microcystis aeruginosa S11-01]